MTAPVRLQLSRRAGFNLQAHSRAINGLPAVRVTRPGFFGNPFTLINAIDAGYLRKTTDPRKINQFLVECFSDWIAGNDTWWQDRESEKRREMLLSRLHLLSGKNLACWCKPRAPCHADVLLGFAENAAAMIAQNAGSGLRQ